MATSGTTKAEGWTARPQWDWKAKIDKGGYGFGGTSSARLVIPGFQPIEFCRSSMEFPDAARNVTLCAAAPTLRSACSQALALLESNHAAWRIKADGPVLAALRAALALAEGGAE